MNIGKYIGIIHLCGIIVVDVYGFIIRKNVFFDKLYIISFVSIPFSWILCKDECIISYLMKKVENEKYILGNNPEKVDDISNLFATERHYFFFYNVNNLLRICSVLIVNKRTTNINDVIMIPTCLFFLSYIYDITCKLNYRKILYPYFQMILCFYFFTVIDICV